VSGLGYYRRGYGCTRAANFVANQLGGNLPASSEALRMLPGIGAIRPRPSPALPTAK